MKKAQRALAMEPRRLHSPAKVRENPKMEHSPAKIRKPKETHDPEENRREALPQMWRTPGIPHMIYKTLRHQVGM